MFVLKNQTFSLFSATPLECCFPFKYAKSELMFEFFQKVIITLYRREARVKM